MGYRAVVVMVDDLHSIWMILAAEHVSPGVGIRFEGPQGLRLPPLEELRIVLLDLAMTGLHPKLERIAQMSIQELDELKEHTDAEVQHEISSRVPLTLYWYDPTDDPFLGYIIRKIASSGFERKLLEILAR